MTDGLYLAAALLTAAGCVFISRRQGVPALIGAMLASLGAVACLAAGGGTHGALLCLLAALCAALPGREKA